MAIKNKNKTETHFFFYSILSLKIAFSLPPLSTNTYSLLTLPFLKSKHLKLMNSWRTPMNNNPETHVTQKQPSATANHHQCPDLHAGNSSSSEKSIIFPYSGAATFNPNPIQNLNISPLNTPSYLNTTRSQSTFTKSTKNERDPRLFCFKTTLNFFRDIYTS